MKNQFIYILGLLIFTIGACTPTEDWDDMYDDVVEAENTSYSFYQTLSEAESEYTLTEDDYALSSNVNIVSSGYITADSNFKEAVAEIIHNKFYSADGNVIDVTFNVVDAVLDKNNAYELTSEDYDALGQSYGNFSSVNTAKTSIASLLDDKYASSSSMGDEKTVKYVLFSKNEVRYFSIDESYSITLLEEEPEDYYTLTDNDYAILGNGYYNNFDDVDQAAERLATLAAQDGYGAQIYACDVYKNYLNEYLVYEFDGTNFASAEIEVYTNTQTFMYNFYTDEDGNSAQLNGVEYTDYESNYWEYTESVIYLSEIDYNAITLTTEDYDSNDLTSKYDNLDLRSEDDSNYSLADESLRAAAVGEMLETFHSAEDDVYYLVTYNYYDGSSGTATELFIKTDGTWIIEGYLE